MIRNLPRGIKVLILIKLTLAAGVILFMHTDLRLGDKIIMAADEAAPQGATASEATNNAVAPTTSDDGYGEAETIRPERKSYLEELFDMPNLDTTSMQKEELGKYQTVIEKRRREVEERLSLLQAREARLLEIEKVIDGKLKNLDEERRFFVDTVQKEKQMSEERLVQLVEFYKKMPPKAAAPVMEKLDKDLVVQLFGKLPQKQITTILSLMNPDTSVKLTEYYGRIRSGREYEMLREINKSLQDEFQNCKGM